MVLSTCECDILPIPRAHLLNYFHLGTMELLSRNKNNLNSELSGGLKKQITCLLGALKDLLSFSR